MAEYIVVMGAEADAWFLPEDDPFRVLAVPTDVGAVDVTFRTRFVDEGYASPVPREMWIEAHGTSDADLPEVMNAFANAAAGVLPLIAVATNAYIGDLEPKIGFDATPTSTRRGYFQSFVREEVGTVPRPGRWVDLEATAAFVRSIIQHERSDRLRRAIAQYALALDHWRPGHETLAVAHLFMAMEALTPVALRHECERQGIDREGLLAAWGIEARGLYAEVRRRLLFCGDDATYTSAKRASDGFEHSFLEFDHVRLLSRDVRDTTARYVRSAVFDLTALEHEHRAKLADAPRDVPFRSFFTQYLWGEFVGEAPDLAVPEEQYPRFLWKSRLKEFSRDGRKFTITPEETTTGRFNNAVQFQPTRFEVWGAEGLEQHEPGTLEAKVIRGETGEIEEIPLTCD